MTKAEFIKKFMRSWHEDWQRIEAAATVTDCPELAAAGKICVAAHKELESVIRKTCDDSYFYPHDSA